MRFFCLLPALLLLQISFSQDQFTQLTDPVFEQKLIDLKIDQSAILDGKILNADAQKVQRLDLSNTKDAAYTSFITSLKGIEAFT